MQGEVIDGLQLASGWPRRDWVPISSYVRVYICKNYAKRGFYHQAVVQKWLTMQDHTWQHIHLQQQFAQNQQQLSKKRDWDKAKTSLWAWSGDTKPSEHIRKLIDWAQKEV